MLDFLQYATTVRLLLGPSGRVICSTVAENAALMQELFGATACAFKPSIPHLVYQYSIFCRQVGLATRLYWGRGPVQASGLWFVGCDGRTVCAGWCICSGQYGRVQHESCSCQLGTCCAWVVCGAFASSSVLSE